jgi:GNAT superfamily N-acetyltransferase
MYGYLACPATLLGEPLRNSRGAGPPYSAGTSGFGLDAWSGTGYQRIVPSCVARPANADDATVAVAVLRESITQLCIADHQNDPATLERWLRNKTNHHFLQWLADERDFVLVAEDESVLCGVGLMQRSGDLRLCYVQPGWQRRGVGSAMLQVLETQAKRWGVDTIRLVSSSGARIFYETHGYLPAGEPVPGFGVLMNYPYMKVLGARRATGQP